MTDTPIQTSKTEKPKKPIQVLRERCGGVSKELAALRREQSKIRKKLTQSLKEGPKTVPELAKAIDIPSHETFWYLMGLKKYGQVVEKEERDGYYEYALKEGEE